MKVLPTLFYDNTIMSILIKNGTIYDGTGSPPFQGDVLVRGNFIAGVGDHKDFEAEKIIDAEGSIVVPGFIDINSGSDRFLYFLSESYQKKFIDMGVTTSIIGTCGFSLAPLVDPRGFTERSWGSKFIGKMNIDWHSFDEFVSSINKRGIGINSASFVGHQTLKDFILQDETRDMKDGELILFGKILEASLKAGALGVSFGLESSESKNTPYKEIYKISKIVSKYNKIISIHLRDSRDIRASFDEIRKINKETGARVVIHHFQPPSSKELSNEYRLIKDTIEDLSTEDILFDCYPNNFEVVPIYQFLPDNIRIKPIREIAKIIKDNKYRDIILDHLKVVVRKNIIIAHTPPSLNFFEGKNIRSFAGDSGLNISESLLKIMELSNLKATCLYEDVNSKLLKEFLSSDKSFIGSDGLGLILKDFDPFMDILRGQVGNISMENIVHKLTGKVADNLGIKNRGTIKEGNYADINIIDSDNKEIKETLVNGSPLLKNNNDKHQPPKLPGQFLRVR